MRIIFAKNIGFCFGVSRAFEMVKENLLTFKKPITTNGSLVHNEEVTQYLKSMGIEKNIRGLNKIKEGTLIITAHGISPITKKKLERKPKLNVLDATCPIVTQAQKIVEKLQKEERKVLIFGDPKHQEVKGLCGAANEKAIIFSSQEDLLKIESNKNEKYGLVSQTTQNLANFNNIQKIAKQKFSDIKIFNTICQASFKRQAETNELAREVDLVLVIGSQTSANSKELYSISSEINSSTFFIETTKDLKKGWFKNVKSVGIVTGASTPDWVIEAITKEIKKFENK